MSLLANKLHAENWALDWSKHNGNKWCAVYEIKTSKLAGSAIYHADKLRERLKVVVRREAEASIRDGYLVVGTVPASAILPSQTTEDIRNGE